MRVGGPVQVADGILIRVLFCIFTSAANKNLRGLIASQLLSPTLLREFFRLVCYADYARYATTNSPMLRRAFYIGAGSIGELYTYAHSRNVAARGRTTHPPGRISGRPRSAPSSGRSPGCEYRGGS